MTRERALKKILYVVFIGVIVALGLKVWLTIKLDWHQQSQAVSPDGNVIAFHMQSTSEAGVAPYGDHIMLVPSWMIFGQYFKAPIFAGYCENGGVHYHWTSKDSLSIKCNGTKILRKLSNYDSVKIEYDITSSEQYNKSIRR
jgi:hypothetical protein